MIVTALLAILFCHPGSGAILQDVTPEQMFNEALDNINKYNLDNKYQNLQFNDFKIAESLYDFASSNVELGDLSTIQLKPKTQPSISTMMSDTGKTISYKATLELKNGYAQYDFLLSFLAVFGSSGTVTSMAKHSFDVEGTIKIDSLKHCRADLAAISVNLGHFQTYIKPGGFIHYIITPFIRYLTNTNSQNLLPIETQITNYIQNSIPKSKFSEIVCNAFNK